MRLTRIENVTSEARLGESLYGSDGKLLLAAGVMLKPSYLRAIGDLGIPAIYLADPATSDVKVPHPVSPMARARMVRTLSDTFGIVAASVRRCAAGETPSAGDLQRHLRSKRFGEVVKAVADSGSVHRLMADVDELLASLMDQDVLLAMNSIKSHDDYTYQHSIDVTIMSVLLARRAGWNSERLKAFGVGCVLHDIGKIVIDPEILNKPGRLTDDEFEQMKAHPLVGHDLILGAAPSLGYLVPQVAFQHHERQDGSGYPRGLRGDNTLGSNTPNMIHDFGAVSAVADVYDAMSSDRPYRRSWPPDRVVKLISEMSEHHLNGKAVELFRSIVSPFPVCSEIRVLNGAHAGFRGIVVQVDGAQLDRPVVRLLHGASGQRVDPLEIDLRIDGDIQIESAQDIEPGATSRGACVPRPKTESSPAVRREAIEQLRQSEAA